MESKLFLRSCMVVAIAMLFTACNSEQAANKETNKQEVGMQQPLDTATLQQTGRKDSSDAKMENEKEENEKEENEKNGKDDD